MGDSANLKNVITKEQLEQFGSQLLTKVDGQHPQAMHRREERQNSPLTAGRDKGKEKITVSSSSSPNGDTSTPARSSKGKRQEQSRHVTTDDDSDATYYPQGSSRSRRTVRSEVSWPSRHRSRSARSREPRRNRRRFSRRTSDSSDSENESPLATHILNAHLPRFKMPQLERYDGSGDPDDHVQTYRTSMRLQGANDSLLCLAFSTTLKKAAREWYNNLAPGSVGSFRDLSRYFRSQFAAGKRRKKNPAQLLAITQKEDETLRSFVNRFNLGKLEIGDCSEDVAMATFMNGVKDRDLIRSLYERPAEDFDDVMNRARSHMLTNEALQSQKEDSLPPRQSKKSKQSETPASKSNKNRRSPSPPRYTPLNRPRTQVLDHIRQEGYNISEPTRLNPELAHQRRKDRYCLFHRDHGHDTEHCQQLKEEIGRLIKEGYLKRFIGKEQNDRAILERKKTEEAPREERTGNDKGPFRVIHTISKRIAEYEKCNHCTNFLHLKGASK